MPVLVILGNLTAACLLGAVLTASGARSRRWLCFPVHPLSKWAVDLSLGTTVMGFWVLGIGLAGLLSTPWLVAGLVIQAAVGRWKRLRRPPSYLLIAALAGLPNLGVAGGPPHFYDAMVYHLGLPWQALMEGAWLPHPENLFASFPPLNQLVATPSLTFGALRTPALLHWWAWVVAATAAAGLARSLGAGRIHSHLVAAACMLLPATPLVPGFPAAEGWLLAALIPAVSNAVRPVLRARQMPGMMLLLGIACAFRVQGLAWFVIAGGLSLLRTRQAVDLLRAAPWAVLGSAPWWIKNAVLLGKPIAPIGDRREGVETLWRDGGSTMLAGASPIEAFFGLVHALSSMSASLAPVFLTASAALLFNRRTRPLGAAVGAGVVAWAATGVLPRFFAPMSILLLVVASALSARRTVRWLAAAAVVWHLAFGVGAQLRYLQMIRPLALLPLSYVEAANHVSPNPPFRLYSEFGDLLEERSRVLVVGEVRPFGLPAPMTIGSQHDVPTIRTLLEAQAEPPEIINKLRATGMTHLIVNFGELERFAHHYPVIPWRTQRGEARWWRFVAALGNPMLEVDGVRAYELKLMHTLPR